MDLSPDSLAKADFSLLVDDAEVAIARKLAEYPRLVEQAAQAHEPHRVAFYAHEIAALFHSLWARGKELPHLRFMVPASSDITMARMALITGTALVLRSSLKLLGVEAISEMR
jgi:arginyl-tRNA synthetase